TTCHGLSTIGCVSIANGVTTFNKSIKFVPGLAAVHRTPLSGRRLFLALKFIEDIVKKLHIAISTDKIDQTVADYSNRLGADPCLIIPGEYALWRTDSLNVSIRQDSSSNSGLLRHLGWEDAEAAEFTQDVDVNGIVWERFSASHQAKEINELWPEVGYQP